jgi:putative superfamily III holin-X
MTDQQTPTGNTENIAAAIQEISERAQLLMREEIELAKAEITIKLMRLARGAAIAAAAGVFMLFGLFLLLDGFAWLAFWLLPVNDLAYFWGFFVVAAILFLLGALAGFIASRLFKAASPPTPVMAIDEAKLIRETVQSDRPESTV